MNMHRRLPAERSERAGTAAASGPRIYNLFPLLVGQIPAWAAELPRIARMGFDWVYVNPFHEAGFSGSLYAVKDPFRLDQRFRNPDGGGDEEQLAAFVTEAAAHGLKVMIDLVINHTSKDAHLAKERPELYHREADGALASPFAVDPDDPTKKTVWGDLAELNYHDPQARNALVPYWSDYMDRLQKLGVRGFRCDAAYKVPAEVWHRLIGEAKGRDPECLFAAETLGCTLEETRATAGAGFDYLFNSFAWWDLRQPWALEQYETLRTIAPSIAFPENHDMERVAGRVEANDPDRVARMLKERYALAAFFSAGVLMPIGYEWGYRRQLHVVESSPEHREETGIDISDYIAAVNRTRSALPALNVEGAQWRVSAPDAPYLALMRIDAGHVTGARNAALVLANTGGSAVTVDPGPLLSRTGGLFGDFAEASPGHPPLPLRPNGSLTLSPGEVRIFAAEALPARSKARSRTPTGEGRVLIETVWPEIEGGRAAVKRVVGENVEVWADIFTDGHEKIAAEILYRCVGESTWRRAPMAFVDNDRWRGHFPLDRNARYQFTIEAWRDRFGSWLSEVEKKQAAGVDVRLETIEGAGIAERAAELAADGPDAGAMAEVRERIKAAGEGSPEQLRLLLDDHNRALVHRHAERENPSRYDRTLEVVADRLAARFSAWYELFPRSMSHDPHRHGTFDDVIRQLPYVKEMGFDVLYFTPIHPIGKTNRKGRNNALTAGPDDPGSVYAIGGEAGGHRDLHPELGTFADFRRMLEAARAHGLEIALDFAVQCSPDHPWIREHPEWFDWRPDGSIKFAENPPKKYEDIVNVEFYDGGLPSLWCELRDVVLFWVSQGVKIFRVDNPHTKPIPFWEWMIREVNDRHPDVLFLAEAFTRPKMMRKLAKIGFQQSYTYFTWRNTKAELIEYMTELSGSEMREYYRPNFFANTPDINPFYLQTSGRAGFIVRGTLAALLSSVYGIYNGFELCEGRPVREGKEEYLDSEKYELKAWDFDRPGNIRDHITKLNRIRRENPALWDFRNIAFTPAWNDQILGFARMTPEKDNCVFALINLDPHNRQECTYEVPLWEFGLPDHGAIEVEDLLQGYRFTLRGKTHRIALDPEVRPVVIWRLIPPSPAAQQPLLQQTRTP